MSKFIRSGKSMTSRNQIFLSSVFAGTLLAFSAIPVQADGLSRSYGFQANTVKTTGLNNKKINFGASDLARTSAFNIFDIFSGRQAERDRKRREKKLRLFASKNKKKVKTTRNYLYRANTKVHLGSSKLRQPLNHTVPLFSANAPDNFDPTANLVGGNKLDDSLAQTIFDALKASDNSVKVTKKQNRAIVDFYKARNFKAVWTDMDGALPSARQALAYLSKADEEGLTSADYLPAGLNGFTDDLVEIESNLDSIARLDITLTAMMVRYGQHASGGRIVPNRLSGYHDLAPPKEKAEKILTGIVKDNNPEDYLSSLHPQHRSYIAFKKALAALNSSKPVKQFAHIRSGGLIKVHRSDERVLLIRERLQDIGLLAKPAEGADLSQVQLDYYDEPLFDAIKEFQKSKGLPADGIIGRRTFAAFNGRKSVNRRNKLVMNMERMRWLPREFGYKYVFVNQPAFKLEVINNKRQVWQTKIVVGKPRNQTSFFIDKMETVVFNPYWGVPQSIITKEMLPRLQANSGYLDQRGFEVYNGRGKRVRSSSIDWYNYGGSRVPFSVRQPPSSRNALGRIKFLFPNKHAIYLHDTPSKHLFSRSSRAFSHGCVRVKDPLKFAENILGWKRSRIDTKIATGKNGSIRLKQSIPVYIAYFTAWADPDGKVNYFGDIYGRDRRLDRALNLITVASK